MRVGVDDLIWREGVASAPTAPERPRARKFALRWETVGHTFSLRPIQAPVLRNRRVTSVCTMAVYVPVGRGRLRSYSLSGGP